MTTQSLRVFLGSKPALVASAAELARQHAVDTKTATRLLKQHDYALVPERGGWVYSPLSSPQSSALAHDSHTCSLLVTALSNNYLLTVDPERLDSVESHLADSERVATSETLAAKLMRFINKLPSAETDLDELARILVLVGLTIARMRDTLPFRAQLTAKGFQPLDPSSTSTSSSKAGT